MIRLIVMPTISDLYKQELIIQHELYHIKGHDAFIKFLQVVVVRIFWFNPLVYLLDSYLNRFCELASTPIYRHSVLTKIPLKKGLIIFL